MTEHIEDLIFNEGVKGTRKAINFLRNVRDMLAGHTSAPVVATVKWDGCVDGDTVVLTDHGDMAIRDLIERLKIDPTIKAMGRNLHSSIMHDTFTPILAGYSDRGTKSWVDVELEDGSVLRMTEDHEVHTTNRGWVPAGELTTEDDITEL